MKIRTILLIFIIVVLVLTFTSFNKQTGKAVDVGSMVESEEFNEIKDIYNKAEVPSIVKTIFGNENINAYILMNDKTKKTLGIVMRKGVLEGINEGGLGDPTMNVYVSEKTLNKIANDELTVIDALNNGDIEYRSLTIKTGIKMGLASVGTKLVSWFT